LQYDIEVMRRMRLSFIALFITTTKTMAFNSLRTASLKHHQYHHRLFRSLTQSREHSKNKSFLYQLPPLSSHNYHHPTSFTTTNQQPLSTIQAAPAFANRNAFFSTLTTASSSRMSSVSTRSPTSATTLRSAVTDVDTEKETPVEIFRKDYKPLPSIVSKINMDFDIRDNLTVVKSQMTIEPNPISRQRGDLELDGDETAVKLKSIQMDGRVLIEETDYELKPDKLIVKASALNDGSGLLETIVELIPEDNTQLSGLYKSGPMYCTQCEAVGFRRITYYPDRPDNMAVFEKVRIEADKESYPILLGNGNLIEAGPASENGRHYSTWCDPFPKPSYLFCIVAGNLGSIKDEFVTKSGNKVQLEIFSEEENVNKLDYAMESLKRSMKWDEDTFGLEYDLGIYNVVAVNDFNMGAMENKGLNVFNTAYVLADQNSATDVDFERVEGVIGHEYFHNWTGNRVTCRDWFQLTLKEGLTVFRDQQFSGDMGSNAVKRIESVSSLRGRQFNEDAGPMSHPIRPESYISMDNFYTATVYSKGAEIIRMYNTLLTSEGFRRGMDLYFERHDGNAVTCDDFRDAMADANFVDLEQFGLWYETSGTPTITYSSEFDVKSGTFKLTLKQSSTNHKPLHIPVSTGLIDKATGEEVVPTKVLELKKLSQTFDFPDLSGDVVPSLLRDFSAPVKLIPATGDVDEETLAFLASGDTDGFNRWESGQKLFTSLIFQKMNNKESGKTMQYVNEAFARTLVDENMDYSIKAYALILPAEIALAEELEEVDPVALHKARGEVKVLISRKHRSELLLMYKQLTADITAEGNEFKVDSISVGRRRLRNTILGYLTSIKESSEEQKIAAELATSHYDAATGLTDKMAALSSLASMDGEGAVARDSYLQRFYNDADGDALVLNKWFAVQATANLPDVLDRVKVLTEHPDFIVSNPNRFRSLISAFTMNSAPFHAKDGEGYKFIADMTAKIDKLNPQVSSRLATSLIQWRKYGADRSKLMKEELKNLSDMQLSDDLFEVVSSGLK